MFCFLRAGVVFFFILVWFGALPMATAQMNWTGPKAFGVVPIVGKGTWEDPRRPDLPQGAAANYRWLPSDDGRWAIVEIGEGAGSKETLAALEKLSQDSAVRGARLFRSGVHGQAEVEHELRRFRKNFSLEDMSSAALAKGAK